jgi:hypothetical protein
MFLRFTVTELHEGSGQPLGIFHAVRYLRDEGQLATEQEDIADQVFDCSVTISMRLVRMSLRPILKL